MQTIGEILEFIKRKDTNVIKLSKEANIPSDRIYSWRKGRGTPKTEDTDKLLKWASNIGNNSNTAEEMQTEENSEIKPEVKEPLKMSMEALLILATANEKLADGYKNTSEANLILTRMLEQDRATASAPKDNREALDAKFEGLREFLLDLASGKSFLSRQEAAAALMNKFVPEDVKRKAAQNIPNN